jgi:hypothetical protein
MNRLFNQSEMNNGVVMRRYVREIMPNDLPMVIDAQVTVDGGVLLDTVRIIPLTPCMECPDCLSGEGSYPLSCSVLGEPQPCTNTDQNKKIAVRLSLVMNNSKKGS